MNWSRFFIVIDKHGAAQTLDHQKRRRPAYRASRRTKAKSKLSTDFVDSHVDNMRKHLPTH
jgi:hypothetical protein